MNIKSTFLFLSCLFLNITLIGQTNISGTITDAVSQQPLSYANIITPNTLDGTSTDVNGFFELSTLDSILSISYAGYQDTTIFIDSDHLNITLNQGVFLTEAIIAVSGIRPKPNHKIHPSISTLSKRDIQQNNEASIAPILNTVPGVFMHSGALNTNRLTIRGIGNRNLFGTAKIKAFIDGIPLTNGSGESSIEDIDLSILDAVTVYKGPASSIYGAGLGGMVSLHVPNDIHRNGNAVSFESTGGSYDLARNTLTFTRANYNKSVMHLNANFTRSDGYRNNNTYNRSAFSGFGKLKINKNEIVNLLFSYNHIHAQIPSSLNRIDFDNVPQRAAFTWDRANGYESNEKIFAGIAYNVTFGEHLSQVSSLNGSFRNTAEVRPFNILRESNNTLGARTEWIYEHKDFDNFISGIEFHLGGELYDERYNWQTYDTDGRGSRDTLLSDNREDRYYSNLFAQLNLDFDHKAALTLGINRNFTSYRFRDYYKVDGSQSSRNQFPRIYSPFLNLGFDLKDMLKLSNDLAISATISHGFSPPKLEESLGPDGLINPAILPEQGWNYELGVRGAVNYKFTYALSFYSMQIKDLLVARRTDFDEFIGINAGRTQHNGIEAALAYKFKVRDFQVNPFINYTYSDYTFKEFIDGDSDHSGNALTGTSPHLLATGIRWDNGTIYGNVLYRFVDAMPIKDDNSVYSEAYQLVNLKLGYRYSFTEKWGIDFFLGSNNLLNEKYASMILINARGFGANLPRFYYPGLPRNFYLGIKVLFGSN